MQILLTPSKTMDFERPAPGFITPTTPVFISEATAVANQIATLSQPQLIDLMHISPAIAVSVHAKYAAWQKGTAPKKPALWAYKGDVYKGMKADEMSARDAAWAGERLLIMSGLYGALRPHDEITAYRLEMKAALSVGTAKNLYEFWDDKLGKFVESRAGGLVFNLCSDEYSRGALRHISGNTRVVTPVFFDTKPNGIIGTVPIYSKMMRGVVARWMIANRIETPEGLERFASHDYMYDVKRSKPDFPAFARKMMKPLVF
jgi:hypothetical protein